MDHLFQAATILQERITAREQVRQGGTLTFRVEGAELELFIGVDTEPCLEPTPCFPCGFKIITPGAAGERTLPATICQKIQPKVSITKTVAHEDDEPVFINQVFVDGDPIIMEYGEFDLLFYIQYMNRFIQSEPELVTYLEHFDASFGGNVWYHKSDGSWLHRLISDSKWNHTYLKAHFGCLCYEDGLIFLESEELKKRGYVLLLRAFNVKYAETINQCRYGRLCDL